MQNKGKMKKKEYMKPSVKTLYIGHDELLAGSIGGIESDGDKNIDVDKGGDDGSDDDAAKRGFFDGGSSAWD